MRRIMTAIAPFIVLLIGWALAIRVELANEAVQTLVRILPYLMVIFALFMSLWYQNSNSFYLVCFILVSYIFISVAATKSPMLLETVLLVSILLPINAVWLGFSKERGILSTYGRNKAIIILGEVIWIFINMMGKSSAQDFEITEAVLKIKAPALILFILAIGVLLASFLLKKQTMDINFVAILLTALIALHFAHRPLLMAIFTTAIFLIVVLALFDVSYSLAFRDTLTGVLSRRAMEQELLKLGNKYTIAIADLDHFKHINDNFGHDVGDEVLKMVASILQTYSGRAKVFRYGGEEFVILFSGVTCDEAIPTLEKMRKAIERRPFVLRAEDRPKDKPDKVPKGSSKGRGVLHVTMSFGVAQKTDMLKSGLEVIRKADEALYKSKNGGRNRITRS